MTTSKERVPYGAQVCNHLPMTICTDCKSFYDVCNKTGRLREERRVALGLPGVRGPLEPVCDVIRGIPTAHMLVDSVTKSLPTDRLTSYLKGMTYDLSYDHHIKATERACAQVRTSLGAPTACFAEGHRVPQQPGNSAMHTLTHLEPPTLVMLGSFVYSPIWGLDTTPYGYRKADTYYVVKWCNSCSEAAY